MKYYHVMDKEGCSYYIMGKSKKIALTNANLTEVAYICEIGVEEFIHRYIETPDHIEFHYFEYNGLKTCPYCDIGYLQPHKEHKNYVCCDYCDYDSYLEELEDMTQHFADTYTLY